MRVPLFKPPDNIQYRKQPVRPYLFQLEVDKWLSVKEIQEKLYKRGVPTAWNFPPAKLVTLPCYPEMTWEEIKFVMGQVEEVLRLSEKC